MRLPLLDGIRVLEVGDSVAIAFCGKTLADLGADVIMLEPPGGRRLRLSPLHDGSPEPGRGVLDTWLSGNKRSITMNAMDGRERATLQELAHRADVLLCGPAAPEVVDLETPNPRLTVVCVSPFGEKGPYAGYRADDLTLFAMGGFSYYLSCPVDDPAQIPPKPNPGQQVALAAGLAAVLATLWGVEATRKKGQGVRVDVSEWEALVHLLYEHTAQLSEGKLPVNRRRRPDAGGITVVGGLVLCLPCQDGWVLASPREDHQFKVWGELIGDPAWAARPEFADSVLRERNGWEIFERSAAWTKLRTQAEVYLAAQERKIACFPVNRMGDLLKMEQLKHREFWTEIHVSGMPPIPAPGMPARVSGPAPLPGRPAPAAGEHSAEIRHELARSSAEAWAAREAARGEGGGIYQHVLEGVRIVDFSWVVAGPFCTKLLALMGADVIKVESARRAQYKERGAWFSVLNNSKKSCTLNLSTDAGRALVKRLIGISDVIVENFSTGVMDRLGLGQEALRAIRPDLVFVSSSGVGRTGPGRNWLAYGSLLQGLSGWTSLFNAPSPKMEAMGIAPSWTDPLTGMWEALIIQAALRYRARTGQGLAVDLSMVESTIPIMGDVFLDIVTGARPVEGASPSACVPRGIYPCSGEDAWIAISVRDASEWEALCNALDAPAWCRAEELRSAVERRRNRDRVDGWLAEATARRSVGALFHQLQAVGVPAAPCYTLPEIIADPQMQARGQFGELAFDTGNVQVTTALPWREDGSEWKGTIRRAPGLGQHNDYVFRNLLGLSEQEYESYRRAGAIE